MAAMRDENGRFVKGYKKPEEWRKSEYGRGRMPTPEERARAAESNRKRFLETLKDEGPSPGKKRCSTCKEMKVVPDDYTMRKHVLKSGVVRYYPSAQCKKCVRERTAKWRAQKLADERTREELRTRQRASAAAYHRRNREERNRQRREERAMRAVEAGRTPRPWRRSRDEDQRISVDATPFLEWFDERPETYTTETEKRYINEARKVESDFLAERNLEIGHIYLDIVDSVMTRAGEFDQVAVLYPPDDEQMAA